MMHPRGCGLGGQLGLPAVVSAQTWPLQVAAFPEGASQEEVFQGGQSKSFHFPGRHCINAEGF